MSKNLRKSLYIGLLALMLVSVGASANNINVNAKHVRTSRIYRHRRNVKRYRHKRNVHKYNVSRIKHLRRVHAWNRKHGSNKAMLRAEAKAKTLRIPNKYFGTYYKPIEGKDYDIYYRPEGYNNYSSPNTLIHLSKHGSFAYTDELKMGVGLASKHYFIPLAKVKKLNTTNKYSKNYLYNGNYALIFSNNNHTHMGLYDLSVNSKKDLFDNSVDGGEKFTKTSIKNGLRLVHKNQSAENKLNIEIDKEDS